MTRIAVVTGAGAGVGRATVQDFARQGYDVALLSRDADRLNSAAADVREFGVRALAIPTDVADAAAVETAAARVESELGPIDVWVNVAMATIFAPFTKSLRRNSKEELNLRTWGRSTELWPLCSACDSETGVRSSMSARLQAIKVPPLRGQLTTNQPIACLRTSLLRKRHS